MTICALVGASEFNAEHFQMMDAEEAFDYVIAVDGGFAHLEAIGRMPDMAMGDFDSLGYVPSIPQVSRFSSNKDASDMELALRRGKTFRHKEVYVYGGLGGRLTPWRICSFSPFSARRALLSRRLIATVPSRSSPAPTLSRCPRAMRERCRFSP